MTSKTDADLEREADTVNVLEFVWKSRVTRLPPEYGVGYLITSESSSAFCEIEHRACSMGSLLNEGGYYLSAHRWMAAKTISETFGKPFLLVVQCLDGIFYHRAETFKRPFVFTGRQNHSEPADIEPRVVINDFKKLNI